jgi:hypothetical protein
MAMSLLVIAFWAVTSYSLVGDTDVTKEHGASIFRVELRAEEVVRLCVQGRGKGKGE